MYVFTDDLHFKTLGEHRFDELESIDLGNIKELVRIKHELSPSNVELTDTTIKVGNRLFDIKYGIELPT